MFSSFLYIHQSEISVSEISPIVEIVEQWKFILYSSNRDYSFYWRVEFIDCLLALLETEITLDEATHQTFITAIAS